DGYEGHVHATVEPSIRVFPGIYVGVNDHFQLTTRPEDVVSAEDAVEVLESQWDAILQRPPTIVEAVLSLKASPSDIAEAKRRADEYARLADAEASTATGRGGDPNNRYLVEKEK